MSWQTWCSTTAAAVQQHIANNTLISNAYKQVAADVNKSNSITTIDATIINPATASRVRLQVQPNPFRDETTVAFNLPGACEAQLRVLDVNGRELLRIDNTYPEGNNSETLRLGSSVASGMLYCELVTPFGVVTQKMVAVR